ncbi:MAG: UDP-N-acetylmuramate--L-alanine ligase [Planctomycetota bacterium]
MSSLDLPRVVHCVGIGGGGLSALAVLLVARGHVVSGSDAAPGFDAEALRRRGIRVARGHAAEHVGAAELLIRSAAVPEHNPEVVAARAAGVPVLKYSEALGRLMAQRRGVAVAGTHGKSTTTALVAHLLRAAGRDPAWVVGARPLSLPEAAGWGAGPALVAEACEFDHSFLNLHYDVALITGTAADHLDCFQNAEGVRTAFRRFAARVPAGGTLVLGVDVPADLDFPVAAGVTVRRVQQALAYHELVESEEGFSGRVDAGPLGGGRFRLRLLGRHNLDNLAAGLLAAQAAGVPLPEALVHVESFGGVARRLQDLGEWPLVPGGTVRLIDDFAHHPQALQAAAAALRARFAGRRLVGLFQPHQVSRTADFLDDFAAALGSFDLVGLCDIFVARDAHPERAEDLLNGLCARAGARVRRLGTAVAAAPAAATLLRPRDVCVVMGAGDIDGLAGNLAGAAARSA